MKVLWVLYQVSHLSLFDLSCVSEFLQHTLRVQHIYQLSADLWKFPRPAPYGVWKCLVFDSEGQLYLPQQISNSTRPLSFPAYILKKVINRKDKNILAQLWKAFLQHYIQDCKEL